MGNDLGSKRNFNNLSILNYKTFDFLILNLITRLIQKIVQAEPILSHSCRTFIINQAMIKKR